MSKLTVSQKASVMTIANTYQEEVLRGIIEAYCNSGILLDLLTEADYEMFESADIDVHDVHVLNYSIEARPIVDKLNELGDIEELCEHLSTLI